MCGRVYRHIGIVQKAGCENNQQEPNNRGRSMENRSEAFFVTGEPDTIWIVSVSQCASYFSFPKGKHEV